MLLTPDMTLEKVQDSFFQILWFIQDKVLGRNFPWKNNAVNSLFALAHPDVFPTALVGVWDELKILGQNSQNSKQQHTDWEIQPEPCGIHPHGKASPLQY